MRQQIPDHLSPKGMSKPFANRGVGCQENHDVFLPLGRQQLERSFQSERSVTLRREVNVKLGKFHYFSCSVRRQNPEEFHGRLNLYDLSSQMDGRAYFDFHVVTLCDLTTVFERGCSTLRNGAVGVLQWYRFAH